jgi:TonB family protein
MSGLLTFSNLLTWCLQVGLVIAVAAAVSFILRLSLPQPRLIFWQAVLLACLALPFLRNWKHETLVFSRVTAAPVSLLTPVAPPPDTALDPIQLIMYALALGAVLRLTGILTGLWKLRGYRRSSVPLIPAPSWGVEAHVQLSDEVSSPVTFGWLDPVILLPSTFPDMPEAQREAILCHEVMHVRRHDWLFTVAEELLRCVLWFHPAIWWVLSEIQLAREEAVDREVIAMTRARDEYVDALLAVAGASPRPDLATASAFLRKRHLKQRVISIFKEIRMSQTKSFSLLAAALVMVAGSCWFIAGAVPLYGAPQTAFDAPGVTVELNGSAVMHRSSVAYPAAAMAKHVEGAVSLQVKVDGSGNVTDASVLNGPDELRKSALQSVLGWHFARDAANTSRVVTISFQLPQGQPPAPVAGSVRISREPFPAVASDHVTLKSITIRGLGAAQKEELLASLPVKEGDTLTAEAAGKLALAVHAYDEHLSFRPYPVSATETRVMIAAPEAAGDGPPPQPALSGYTGTAQRVGGNVMQASLLSQPKPVYPPFAKIARIQGTVRFEVVIDAGGHVQNLHLISGPPLLVQSAMEAVRQWVYKPILLNGEPVEVITTVDVNFTLAQDLPQQ